MNIPRSAMPRKMSSDSIRLVGVVGRIIGGGNLSSHADVAILLDELDRGLTNS